MAVAFSVASWNVEHFRGEPERVGDVIEFLSEQDPDVFALIEVEGKTVFGQLTDQMTGYSFHITEGPQTQEILLGVRPHLTPFFTQKVEFKSGNAYLRPGALLTVTVDEVPYSLLFLHTKSGNDPKGFGLRDDMSRRAFKFRRTLDKAVGGRANYIFLGDLNTMGLKYPYKKSIDVEYELKRLDHRASYRKMRRLTKTHSATWTGGTGSDLPDSDLDQVVAAKRLSFTSFGGAEVSVRGWPRLNGQERKEWIKTHSDHALLYFEVEKVEEPES